MEIQKVQSNQPSFGTFVKIDPFTARILSVSKAKNKVLKSIRHLQKNGVDDILYLSLGHKEHFSLKASVYKRENNDYFISSAQEEPISYIMKDGRTKLVNIIKMYEEAKNNLNNVVINKKEFMRFLQYIE